MEVRRPVSVRVSVRCVLESKPGPANAVVLSDETVALRVDVLGTVTSVHSETGHVSFEVDDGSGCVVVRAFDPLPYLPAVSEIVRVIGRPRHYQQTVMIVPDIVKTVKDSNWVLVRKNSLNTRFVSSEVFSSEPKLLRIIRALDSGDGADIEDVISESKDSNAEAELERLMRAGRIFSPRAGRIKVV